MSFKCFNCNRTFSRRSTLTRHVNKCMLTIKSSDEYDHNISSSNDTNNFHNLDKTLEFSKIPSINFNNSDFTSEVFIYNVYILFFLIFFLQFLLIFLKNFEEVCSTSEMLPHKNTSHYFEDFSDNSEVSNKNLSNFPNEAYADLMTLVLKNNLSNSIGNEIISFFNKHSNLSISPLPKNI